ncbi:hypothetical protein ACW7N6_38100 [Streptomyces sp. UC1A3]
MSDERYQVLFQGGNGRDNLSDPEPLDDARHTARELERKGYTVGAVMDVKSAREYMEYRYAPTYRGVKVPDDVRNDHTPRRVYDAWRRGVDAGLNEAADTVVRETRNGTGRPGVSKVWDEMNNHAVRLADRLRNEGGRGDR